MIVGGDGCQLWVIDDDELTVDSLYISSVVYQPFQPTTRVLPASDIIEGRVAAERGTCGEVDFAQEGRVRRDAENEPASVLIPVPFNILKLQAEGRTDKCTGG